VSDSYQAIYDAVRSRISGGNIAEAVAEVARNAFDISHYGAMLYQDFSIAAAEMQRPSAIFRPVLSREGDQWRALYGDDIVQGCAGWGSCPDDAMRDFDKNWHTKRPSKAVEAKI
jgi:hypothetical protein